MTKNASDVGNPKSLDLNNIQKAHLNGELNIYAPIEAYSEEWVHKMDDDGNFIEAYPKPNTRRRADLPSVSEQWREDAKRKYTNEQSTSNRRHPRSRN